MSIFDSCQKIKITDEVKSFVALKYTGATTVEEFVDMLPDTVCFMAYKKLCTELLVYSRNPNTFERPSKPALINLLYGPNSEKAMQEIKNALYLYHSLV